MMSNRRHVPPLIDLTGWDRLPERHEPLPGQKNLFDVDSLESFVPQCGNDPSQPVGQSELFDSGRDLPGAGERDQAILWDVA